MSPSGFAGGGQAGYNYQIGSFILGLETDIQYRNATASNAGSFGVATGDVTTFESEQNWYGTLRPRIGIAPALPNMNMLLYFTGGLAYGDIKDQFTENRQTVPGASRIFSDSSTRIGWTAGGGAEIPLNLFGVNGLVVGAEYMHLDFGSETISAPLQTIAGTSFPAEANKFFDGSDIFRLRVSYRFGAPTPPPAPATPVVAAPPAAVAPSQQMFIVFFEFDKSALTPDGAKVVAAAASPFKSGKSGVAIAGYTDLARTQTYNLALSHRRADVVKSALVKDGVPVSAINEAWHGKENPRVPTADGVREPQNRRVEITM